ncbi:winged helix-turn-helix domain-containing protein [uncultured Bacteroides sp.]|uniref:winged helix-turn-helix domain-containing protein n=1 Tax=uncultured Bacteroides sp. TaxID=162156 RepID=UPI00261B0F2C|nr:winged helix-turn-helix domain-containing protein [uncultured Bacteroides sp.]
MESNLIGKNAGTIWNILHESNEKVEVARLKKESHLTSMRPKRKDARISGIIYWPSNTLPVWKKAVSK